MIILLAGLNFSNAENSSSLKEDSIVNLEADVHKVEALLNLSAELAKEKPERAIYYALEAKQISMKLSFTNGIGLAYKAIAYVHYIHNNFPQAIENYNEAVQFLNKGESDIVLAEIYENVGNLYFQQSVYDLAMKKFMQSIAIYKAHNNIQGMGRLYHLIGDIHMIQENYSNAEENYLHALEMSEQSNDLENIVYVYLSLGNLNELKGKKDIALRYFSEAITVSEEMKSELLLAQSMMKLAHILLKEGKPQEALSYLKRAGVVFNGHEYTEFLAENYLEFGRYYLLKEDLDSAEWCLSQTRSMADSLNILWMLKEYYNELSNYYFLKGSFKESLLAYRNYKLYSDSLYKKDYLKSITQLEMTAEFNRIEKKRMLDEVKRTEIQKYKAHQKNLLITGLAILALALMGFLFYVVRNYRKSQSLGRKLQFQKKEIEQKNLELGKKAEQIRKNAEDLSYLNQELQKLSVVASKTDNAVIIADETGTFLWVNESYCKLFECSKEQLLRSQPGLIEPGTPDEIRKIIEQCREQKTSAYYEQKSFSNKGREIWMQVTITPVLDAREKIENLIAVCTDISELKKAEKEIVSQRDLLLHQKQEITDSIRYAQRIQTAVIPRLSNIKEFVDDYFVLFKPRDIVSGDFFYTQKKEDLIIVGVADCTGHGVPGAFMSMLGMAFINDIVLRETKLDAASLLDRLRLRVINALQQRGVPGEQKDGMDVSLLCFNYKSGEATWAGANNAAYMLPVDERRFSGDRFEKFVMDEHILLELKPDKMPISIYDKLENFSALEISLEKGDQIYMFSDGYPDQFGGPKGKKFKYQAFRKLICKNSNMSMLDQQEFLDFEIERWMVSPDGKKSYEQIDDITVLGIKF